MTEPNTELPPLAQPWATCIAPTAWAVQLTEGADWGAIAAWVGGTVESIRDATDEYQSCITIPREGGGPPQVAHDNWWVIRNEAGGRIVATPTFVSADVVAELRAKRGGFDELVAATIRTAVDEWRVHNDPADVHGVSMAEYIWRSLADAGLLASARLDQLTAEVERLKDVDADAFGARFQVQCLDIALGRTARVLTRLLTDANIAPPFEKRLPHLGFRVEEEFKAVVQQRDEALAALEKQQALLAQAINGEQLARLHRYARDLQDAEPDISGDDNLSTEDAYNRGYADADVATGKALTALLDVTFNEVLDSPEFRAALTNESSISQPEQPDPNDVEATVAFCQALIPKIRASLDRKRPPFPYEARQWMDEGARVECFSGRDPSEVVHEGWIIGMTEAPTVRVQKDDGRIVSWVLGITRRQDVSGQLQANSNLLQPLEQGDEAPVSLEQLSGATCGKTGSATPEACDGTCPHCADEIAPHEFVREPACSECETNCHDCGKPDQHPAHQIVENGDPT